MREKRSRGEQSSESESDRYLFLHISFAYQIMEYISVLFACLFVGAVASELFLEGSKLFSAIFTFAVAGTGLAAYQKVRLHCNGKYNAGILASISMIPAAYLFRLPVSFIYLLLWFGCFFLFCRGHNCRISRKVKNLALCLGSVFSVSLLVGFQLEHYDRLEILHLHALSDVFQMVSAFCIAVLFFSTFLVMLLSSVSGYQAEKQTWIPDIPAHRMKFCLLAMCGLLLCWGVYFIAYYPGCMTYDSFAELNMQLSGAPLTNHHPILHQMIIRMFCRAGLKMGSLSTGVAFYSIFQMILLAFAFVMAADCLRSEGVSTVLTVAVLVCCGVFTINGFYSIVMWKDVPFAAVVLLLCTEIVKGAGRTQAEGRFGWYGKVAVLSFLFCALRNNAFYAFLLGFPFVILAIGRKRIQLWLCYLAVILSFSGYQLLLSNVMHVQKTETREMLSVPVQQIARTVRDRGESFSSEDRIILSEVFEDSDTIGERYDPRLSDPVKDTFRSEVFDADPFRYVSLWARMAVRNPASYLTAFLMQCYGYWYPDAEYWMIAPQIDENSYGLEHRQESQFLRKELEMTHYRLAGIYPVSVFYRIGTYIWILLVAAAVFCFSGRRELASPIWLLTMLWVTNLASPVHAEFRYAYGIVVSVPMFVALAVSCAGWPEYEERISERRHDKKSSR